MALDFNPLRVIDGPLVRRFDLNERGRDFVVGDLHGAFSLLERALEIAEFEPSRDRLFCVGDLIDRGAQSRNAAEFLRSPGVHSVLGNHDVDFLMSSASEIRSLAAVNFNGMGWARDLSNKEIRELQSCLAKLPLAIEVVTTTGTVGIVHAEVPEGASWQDFVLSIERGEQGSCATALQGRRAAKRAAAGALLPAVQGIDRIVVGHTWMLEGHMRSGNYLFLDTGAVLREQSSGSNVGCLTLMELSTTLDEFDESVERSDQAIVVVGCRAWSA